MASATASPRECALTASKLHPPAGQGNSASGLWCLLTPNPRFLTTATVATLSASVAAFGTTTSFGGTATFSGSTVHTGHATFTSATISSNLNVSGAGSLSTLAASGAANFSSTLGVTGIATFSKVLQINAGSATISYLRAGTGQWATYNDGGDGDSFKVLDVINGTGAKVVKASPGWLSMSDRRAKTNIAELAVLNKVADFRAVSFTWKKTGKRGIGVIAQELYSLFPELVGVGSDDDAPFAGGLSDPGAWTVAESHLGAIALQG